MGSDLSVPDHCLSFNFVHADTKHIINKWLSCFAVLSPSSNKSMINAGSSSWPFSDEYRLAFQY